MSIFEINDKPFDKKDESNEKQEQLNSLFQNKDLYSLIKNKTIWIWRKKMKTLFEVKKKKNFILFFK